MKDTPTPRGTCRILYVSDPSSIATNLLPDPVEADDLRRWVDLLADNEVDAFDQEVYSQGWTAYWRSDQYEYDRRIQHRRFLPMLDRDQQPLDVLIDQSRHRGMRFIAGFRMNDNHAHQAKEQGVGIAAYIAAHPEWTLTAFPEGDYYNLSAPLDFTFEEVREYVLGVMQEVAERFDIDGMEMCFRDHAYFPVNTGRERAHYMTDLVRRIHAMLEAQSKVRGRKILLGARLFSTLAECNDMGLDLETWIGEGLLDFVCPQDTMYADFSVPYPEFARLARQSECMLYPGLLPWTSVRARNRLNQIPLTSANSRALAHTMYAAGADGISIYNHFCPMWGMPFYPQALAILHELRDPAKISAGERHYVFDPTWGEHTGFRIDRTSTGAIKANRVVLDRSAERLSGEYCFSLYEDLGLAHAAVLIFRGFGLREQDDLAIRLNGHLIPPTAVWQTRESNAPPNEWLHARKSGSRMLKCIPEQARIDFRTQKEPAFSTRWFSLKPSLVECGQNVIHFTLTSADPVAADSITIDEIEVLVQPK